MKQLSLAIALMLGLASPGYPQVPKTDQDRDAQAFRVQVWGDILPDFTSRVQGYFDLRRELQKGLPPLRVTADPAEIKRAVHALAERVRVARATAREGDIFTPAISVEFRKALTLEMNAETRASIMDEDTSSVSDHINGSYSERKPLSTVPPNILRTLPRLPEDIEYRFIGCRLILLDTRANLIVDRMPNAIQCEGKTPR